MNLSNSWLLAAPLLPLAVRGLLVVYYHRFMSEEISDKEKNAIEHRSLILALSGFSFTAAIGLPAYGIAADVDTSLATYLVALSFFCYLGSLNLQAYKFTRRRDQFATALADTATFCLIGAILVMVWLATKFNRPMFYILALVATCIWGFDFFTRITYWVSFFKGKKLYD